jgi:hypothetical protein
MWGVAFTACVVILFFFFQYNPAFFLVLHDAFSSRFFKTNVLFLYSFFSSTYISFMFPLASFSVWPLSLLEAAFFLL